MLFIFINVSFDIIFINANCQILSGNMILERDGRKVIGYVFSRTGEKSKLYSQEISVGKEAKEVAIILTKNVPVKVAKKPLTKEDVLKLLKKV